MSIIIVNEVVSTSPGGSGTLTIPSTTAGNVLIVAALSYSNSGVQWISPNFVTSDVDGLFTEVQYWNLQGGSAWDFATLVGTNCSVDILYVVTAGGATSISYNANDSLDGLFYYELSGLQTPVVLDDFQVADGSGTTVVGATLGGSGSNDFCLQNLASRETTPSGITSPWTIDPNFSSVEDGTAYIIGGNGAQSAPTWTPANTDDWVCVSAAFVGTGVAGPNLTFLNTICGNVGDSVVINGSNFGSTQGSSTVSFNGTNAAVSAWSDTQITATVPTGATTGGVVVTTSGGGSSNSITFTIPCVGIQYKVGRTCSITVPTTYNGYSTRWFGFDIPSLLDAGDFLIGWGGFTYNESEPDDPFYFNVVQIDKASFTIAQQLLVQLDPTFPFWTVTWVALDVPNNKMYAGAQTRDDGSGASNYPYQIFVLDLTSFTVLTTSNQVISMGEGFYSGGNESDSMAFVSNGYVVALTEQAGVSLSLYDISTNTLSVVDNTGSAVGCLQVDSTGKMYRLYTNSGDTALVLDTATLPSTSFSTVGTYSYTNFGDSFQSTTVMYLDEANNLMYIPTAFAASSTYWLQVDLGTGVVINTFADSRLAGYPGSAVAGWNGYTPRFPDSASPNNIYLVDASNNQTLQVNVTGPLGSNYGNGFWDFVFTGVPHPMYGNAFNGFDLAAGDIYTWYEYVLSSFCGGLSTPAVGNPLID